MKNKVLLFGPFPPPYGGVAIFMNNLFVLLSATESNFKFLAFTQEAIEFDAKNIIRLFPKPWYLIQWTKNLFLARLCFDSNEFCFEYPNWKLAVFWLLHKRTLNFKWVKMIHDGSLPDRFKSFNWLQKKIFFRMLPLVDEIIVVNEVLADWLRNDIGYKKHVNIIGSLLPDDSNFDDDIVLDEKVNHFINNHEKIIISIGVFDELYGFHDVVDVINKIRIQKHLNLGVILIDGAFINDPDYEEMVLDGRDWVLKLSQVKRNMVKNIINRCDIFIRAGKFESYGLSRIEALMCNKPVIATNVGETRGMLLFEYGDKRKLEEHLQICLFSNHISNSNYWVNYFHQIAEENWLKLYYLIK